MGVAPAALPPESRGTGADAYQAWVAEDRHGTMDYMARDPERREDITRWFPPARSVLVLGFRYGPGPAPGGIPETGSGRIASYARSADYHRRIRPILKTLLERLQEAAPGTRGKAFVDTSPVLERLYARYAGLGWVGKNTLLLSRRAGSFLFLCGLALDLELSYDSPEPDRCGSCTRCLSACPTDAFPAPRVLDASRCVAYLTIEHRGPVPEPLRAGMGDWLFGCDVCQEVCPWNRFSARGPLFEPRLPPRLPLEEAAVMTDERFARELSGTPLERAGRAGLARNALLCMGNSADPSHAPTLGRMARDPDPTLAEAARWSLQRLERPEEAAA